MLPTFTQNSSLNPHSHPVGWEQLSSTVFLQVRKLKAGKEGNTTVPSDSELSAFLRFCSVVSRPGFWFGFAFGDFFGGFLGKS